MRAHTNWKDEMGKRFAIVASATRGRSAAWISSIALVVMVLGAAWLAAAPQAAEARPSPCGGGPQKYKSEIDDFIVRNVGCNYAKRVASHHIKTGDRRFNGWKCDDDKQGEGVDTTCQRHRKGEIQRIDYSLKRLGARHAALGAQTATSSTGDPVDSTPPDLQLWGPKKQDPQDDYPGCDGHHCDLKIKVSCGDEWCTARAKGRLTNVKRDKLPPSDPYDIAPGETIKGSSGPELRSGVQRKQVRKALAEGKNVQAKVTVRAMDTSGNVATSKRTIKLVKSTKQGFNQRFDAVK